MHRFGFKQVATLAGILIGFGLFTSEASAATMGLLELAGNGPAIVGLNSIDWTPPTGPPNGSFTVIGGTTLTSAAGSPAVGSTGFLLDASSSTVFPLANFITLPTVPGLGFDLNGFGPGSSNTNCGTATASLGSCSIFAGSPIILTAIQVGTTIETSVSLSAFGTAHDGTSPNSTWQGDFTTQIPDETPAQIQADFGCPTGASTPAACTNQGVTKSASYSAAVVATAGVPVVTPEPDTLALLGIGLLSLVALYRMNKKKVM